MGDGWPWDSNLKMGTAVAGLKMANVTFMNQEIYKDHQGSSPHKKQRLRLGYVMAIGDTDLSAGKDVTGFYKPA